MTDLIKTCLIIIVTLCSVASVTAETYTYLDNSPIDNRTLAVFAEQAKVTFDTDTNILDISVKFDKSVLRPDGFQFIISHGPAPSTSGEQATIFFDASTPGLPKLSAYAYNALGHINNCGNDPGSYEVGKKPAQAPDTIKDSSDTAWIISTTDVETTTHRTLAATLDVSDIINHTPAYPDATFSWTGIGFQDTIGLWLWATALSATPNYNASNFLTTWPSVNNTCIFYDFGDRATNVGPLCTGANTDLTINFDTPANFTITATDGDGDDLTVSYMGVPSAANVTPSAGTHSSPVDVVFDWTPTVADSGTTNNFKATFSDGVNPSIDCPVTINVPANKEPNCQISGALENQTCDGAETRMELDGLKSFDPEGNSLTYAWNIDCNGAASIENDQTATPTLVFTGPNNGDDVECSVTLVVNDGGMSSSCKATASVNPCAQCSDQDVSDILALLDGNTFTMSKLVKNAASELKRVTGQKIPTAVRNQVKEARSLHIDAWETINQVPSTIISCTNANACVNVSHAPAISEFANDSTSILALVESVTKRVRKALKRNPNVGNRKRWKRIRAKARRLDATNQAEANGLPQVNTVCP